MKHDNEMETISPLLTICARNSPVTVEIPAQSPVTRRVDVFFDLLLNNQLSKQSWRQWFETPLHSLWRHYNDDVLLFKMAGVLSTYFAPYSWKKYSICLNSILA